jgi:peptidoglycan/xylan/chitin deacetylase (PgdA/CDA1 family)
MRRVLKRSIELVLRCSGAPRLLRAARRGDTLVLAYHNVVPEGERTAGDSSLHLPQREFARQLDLLGRTHEVVPLASLPAAGEARGRPRAVVTFDDAYAGAVTAAVHELELRGLPATIFVAPAFVGGGSFWWDALAGPAGLAPEVRRHALDALAGRDREVRRWAQREGLAVRAVPPHMTVATEEQLRRAASVPGISLGSHTWSHVNLSAVPADELEAELSRPLAWLRARFGPVVPWVSYPYGLSSAAVERAAERTGYAGGFRVEGGWLTGSHSGGRYLLPRLNVPSGISLNGFELLTSGLR